MTLRSAEPEVGHTTEPLQGRTVLVTRAPHQASALAEALRLRGAQPILIPTIVIEPPASYAALDAALACLGSYDWMVFTSANAVEAFHGRAQFLRLTHLPRQIAVIGAGTHRAASHIGLTVDLAPPQPIAESLAQALAPYAARRSFLIVRAAEARDVLPESLCQAGGRVTIAEAYRTQVPQSSVAALRDLFAAPAHHPHAVTFTSASTARHLLALLELALLELPPAIVRASIGPITSAAMRELGIPPHVEAEDASVPGLVDALSRHFAATIS